MQANLDRRGAGASTVQFKSPVEFRIGYFIDNVLIARSDTFVFSSALLPYVCAF